MSWAGAEHGTGQRAASASAAKLELKETKLTSIANAVIAAQYRRYRISPDGLHVAVLNRNGAKFSVSVDGVEGKVYDWIVADTLRFTADSSAEVYVVQQEGKMFVVAGGKEAKAYHEIINAELLLSRQGRRIGYRVRTAPKGKPMMVVDDQESKAYDQVGALSFSTDGRHVAFAASSEKKQSFIVDGVSGETYDRVIAPSFTFSPDGKRFAYGAIQDEKKKVTVIVDWREQAECDEMGLPLFSPDSAHLAYAVRREGKMAVVLDGKEQASCDQIIADSMHFSPDGKRLAYIAARRETISEGGKEKTAVAGVLRPGWAGNEDL